MSTTFFCNLNVPILVAEDRYKYIPFVAVFRSVPFDQVDAWVMHPDGRPRTDRELAAEVLVELRPSPDTTDAEAPRGFEIGDILQLDRAAAIIVATFLAALPRV